MQSTVSRCASCEPYTFNTPKLPTHAQVSRCCSLGSAPQNLICPQLYIPVNYIQPEICAMLRSLEFAYCSKNRLHGMASKPICEDQAGSTMYDPLRVVPSNEPPKRFFRTFWRMTARKLLELERNDHCFEIKHT